MQISMNRAFDASSNMAIGFSDGRKAGTGLEERVRDALDTLLVRGVRISYPMVAAEADVAKSTLYRNRAVAKMVDEAREATRYLPRRQDADAAVADALRLEVERLRHANEALEAELDGLREENRALRRKLVAQGAVYAIVSLSDAA